MIEREGDIGDGQNRHFLRLHRLEDDDFIVEVDSPLDLIYPGSSSVGFCPPDAGGKSPLTYKSLTNLFEAMARESSIGEEAGKGTEK